MHLAKRKVPLHGSPPYQLRSSGLPYTKRAFQDALALRYDWQPLQSPSTCGCGTRCSIEHALSCHKRGFPSIRNNEIRDLTANLLTEVCSDVRIEPDLQPLIYPHAASSRQTSVATCYRKHEAMKKRAYEQRIREVEHSSFTPLVLSATGGMAVEATTFYKRLAACLADKWEQPYSSTLAWLRCRLTFSLLRSAIQCIRGACSSRGHASKPPPPIDLAIYLQITVELN